MITDPRPCDAPPSSCGTPSGWRRGGRCLRCRHARNEEEQNRRHPPLTRHERARVLAVLNAGYTPDQAAEEVGRVGRSLYYFARRDAEMAAALAGEPPEAQNLARLGDYLAALTRNVGDIPAAHAEIGVTGEEAEKWAALPGFGRAEEAVQRMLDGIRRRNGREEFSRLWADGLSAAEIAEKIGIAEQYVYVLARRMGLPPRQTRVTDNDREALAQLWADESLTVADITERLGLGDTAVHFHARAMGLPRRRDMHRSREEKP